MRKRTSVAIALTVALVVMLPLVSTLGSHPHTALASPNSCTAPIFISEFHYDNDGGDTGELVEVG